MRGGGGLSEQESSWIPAFAGMTWVGKACLSFSPDSNAPPRDDAQGNEERCSAFVFFAIVVVVVRFFAAVRAEPAALYVRFHGHLRRIVADRNVEDAVHRLRCRRVDLEGSRALDLAGADELPLLRCARAAHNLIAAFVAIACIERPLEIALGD